MTKVTGLIMRSQFVLHGVRGRVNLADFRHNFLHLFYSRFVAPMTDKVSFCENSIGRAVSMNSYRQEAFLLLNIIMRITWETFMSPLYYDGQVDYVLLYTRLS